MKPGDLERQMWWAWGVGVALGIVIGLFLATSFLTVVQGVIGG